MYIVLHRPKILCLWVSGCGARKMESMSDADIENDVHAFLTKFLKKEYGSIPRPTGIKVSMH